MVPFVHRAESSFELRSKSLATANLIKIANFTKLLRKKSQNINIDVFSFQQFTRVCALQIKSYGQRGGGRVAILPSSFRTFVRSKATNYDVLLMVFTHTKIRIKWLFNVLKVSSRLHSILAHFLIAVAYNFRLLYGKLPLLRFSNVFPNRRIEIKKK